VHDEKSMVVHGHKNSVEQKGEDRNTPSQGTLRAKDEAESEEQGAIARVKRRGCRFQK